MTQMKTILDLKDEVQRAHVQQLERIRSAEMETISARNQTQMHQEALRQANRTIKKLEVRLHLPRCVHFVHLRVVCVCETAAARLQAREFISPLLCLRQCCLTEKQGTRAMWKV